MAYDDQKALEATKEWLSNIVIGLNLCPFAKQPYLDSKVRISIINSSSDEEVFQELIREINLISNSPTNEIETTLLVCTESFTDFNDYLGFLDIANRLLVELDLVGVLQLASFHPNYVFADVESEDQSNFTNRSPFPIFHIIREETLTRINQNPESLEKIPERNIELMRGMSEGQLRKYFSWFFDKG